MAIVFQKIAGVKNAIGQGAQTLAHAGLGRRDHARDGGLDGVGAIARDEIGDAGAGHVQRGDEGADVEAQRARQARRRDDHLQHILAQLVPVDELHAGNAHALLKDLAGLGRPTGEVHAAHIGLMGLHARPGDDRVAREDRADHLHIVLVEGADIGVVADEHVAIAHHMFRFVGDMADEGAADRRLIGHLKAHGGDGAIGQEEPGEKVRGLRHRGRTGDALQRDPHLLGDGDQPVADDVVNDGAERVIGHGASLT